MGMGFSCRKNAFFQAPIKLAQPVPAPELRANNFTQDDGKGGVGFKGGSLHDGFDGFGGSGKRLALLLLVLQNTLPRDDHDGFGGFGGCGGFGRDGYSP